MIKRVSGSTLPKVAFDTSETASAKRTVGRLPLGPRLFQATQRATLCVAMMGQLCLTTPALAGVVTGTNHRHGAPIELVGERFFTSLRNIDEQLADVRKELQQSKREKAASMFPWLYELFSSDDELQERETALEESKRHVRDSSSVYDERAFVALRAAGLRVDVPAWERTGMAAVLAFVEAWEAQTGRQLGDLSTADQAYLLQSRVKTLQPRELESNIQWLQQTPAQFLGDFAGWARTGRHTHDKRVLDHAATLYDEARTNIKPEDLVYLSSVEDKTFEHLRSGLEMLQRAGWNTNGPAQPPSFQAPNDRRTALQIAAPVAIAGRGASVTVELNSALSAWTYPVTLSVDRFLQVTETLRAEGVSPSAAHFEAVALLSLPPELPNAAAQSAFLSKTLQFDDRPGALREVVAIILQSADGFDDLRGFMSECQNRLGRRLTTSEFTAFHQQHEAGQTVDDLLPKEQTAHALRFDSQASSSDLYLWNHLSPTERSRTREQLVEGLVTRIASGNDRADTSAEYSERLDQNLAKLSTSDLQRMTVVLDALRSPRVRNAIARQVRADVERMDTELGGSFLVVDGERRFVPLTPKETQSDNVYTHPSDEIDPRSTFVTAHIHAGGSRFAGPSSSHDGFFADRGFVWSQARSDLVITRVDDTTFGIDYYTPNGAVVDLGTFSSNRNNPRN